MSAERPYKKPLIVAGGIAAVGLLAWGVNGGKPRPRSIKEALERFRDPTDALRAPKVQVMSLLLRSQARSASPGELVASIAERDEPDELARRRMLRTMSSLGKTAFGDFAFANLAVDLDRVDEYGKVIELYQPTPVAIDLYDAGELPEVSGN
jgi:hypothetical protein